MDAIIIQTMTRYNLYWGLKSDTIGAEYHYTEEYETQEEAENDVFDHALEEYELYAGTDDYPDWDQVFSDYCKEHNLDEDESTFNINTISAIEKVYNRIVKGYIDSYVVETKKDVIPEDELIFRS
jgi:hypothetical protein